MKLPYPISDLDRAEIEKRFTHHPPRENQIRRYEFVRKLAKRIATFLTEVCPPSRELALAMTNLEQAVFWANAAIARNEDETP